MHGTDTRPPLTRERVLRAAITLADERGIESLSMRKLARELGFEMMSLYNHVANKKSLLNGMVDLVGAEIRSPATGGDWKTAMRDSAISARQVLVRHPWACLLWSNSWPGPARLQYSESLLRCLRDAGLSCELAHRGFHALNTHIVGFALQELAMPLNEAKLGQAAADLLLEIPGDEFPYLADHVMQHLRDSSEDGVFEFVLDLILEGLAHEKGARGSLSGE